jgi:predicted nucleotidyltransferase component of viral defense system
MIQPQYRAQVDLLLDVLPYVAKEKCFAMKGGTAINMFIWDMPRLSVDIDLTYIHFDDRKTAFALISESILRIKDDLLKSIPGIQVETSGVAPGQHDKLLCVRGGTKIKVEVNTTMRGLIKPAQLKQTTPAVRKEFDKFAAINIVSDAELFGGKICAALDRQHPRDLFDMHQLFNSGGITEEIKNGFIIALLSHNKPINEMFSPNLQNQEAAFTGQFEGMGLKPFSYTDFENTRERLVKEINSLLTKNDKKLLLSFKDGNPDWSMSDTAQLQNLPALKWKLQNIRKFKAQDPKQHMVMMRKLEKVLE